MLQYLSVMIVGVKTNHPTKNCSIKYAKMTDSAHTALRTRVKTHHVVPDMAPKSLERGINDETER